MEEGRGASANVLLDRGLYISYWAGRQLRFNQIANWWPAHHVAHAVHRARADPPARKSIPEGMRRRIVAVQQDAAAAKGTAGADRNREAMTLGEKIGEAPLDPTGGDQRRRHDGDRVGDRERRIAAHESASCDTAFTERTAARHRIPQSNPERHPERRPRVELFVSGHWLRARKAQRVRRVVLKIAADLRRINHN